MDLFARARTSDARNIPSPINLTFPLRVKVCLATTSRHGDLMDTWSRRQQLFVDKRNVVQTPAAGFATGQKFLGTTFPPRRGHFLARALARSGTTKLSARALVIASSHASQLDARKQPRNMVMACSPVASSTEPKVHRTNKRNSNVRRITLGKDHTIRRKLGGSLGPSRRALMC